ncbi:hypothetical protein [Brevibacillus sp. H7]|jgi:hypothetical protein|uniref:hypothetical protein n=1 Tax=Brevibacillus sp. H7 TaxID=3349138 RepID=UPI0038041949
MERELIEIPQVDIPDEVTQVDRPEIGETTPHPDPTSPQADLPASPERSGPIGFAP